MTKRRNSDFFWAAHVLMQGVHTLMTIICYTKIATTARQHWSTGRKVRMRCSASLLASAALLGVLLQVLPSYAGAFGKETYEECVLNNLKGVNDRHVMQAVRNACKRKTTPKRCRYIFDKSLDDYADSEHQHSSPPPVSSKFQNPYDETISSYDYYGTSKRTTDAIARKDLDLHKCIEECEKANMYERHFGECATD